MTTSEEITEKIALAAKTGIQSSSNDAGSMTAMPLGDQIKAAQFVAAQNASAKSHFGMRMTKLVPPGGG